MAAKQKERDKNGRSPETAEREVSDLATMKQQIDEAERLADERFFIEYQRLCEHHGRRIQMVPNGLNDDSSIRWVAAVQRLN